MMSELCNIMFYLGALTKNFVRLILFVAQTLVYLTHFVPLGRLFSFVIALLYLFKVAVVMRLLMQIIGYNSKPIIKLHFL